MGNQKLFDYLNQEANWIALESDMQEVRDIVLAEAGFKWIPVSERLPEKDESERKVFVTFAFTDLSENINVAESIYGDGEFLLLTDRGMYYSGNPLVSVIAWMPLPKPYNPQP